MRAQMMMSTREPDQVAGRPAIEIAHLRKTYGTLVAVDDVSFSVAEGEIFGILGPNGAGKTRPSNAPSGSGCRTRARSG
jgi:ABC-type branched-subunit amino acid transport system ATPase component